jgi:thiamine biosynthesis lipoprotein
LIAKIQLRDEALSVSAVWGKSFQAEGKTFGHVLDPRTGHPAAHASLAAVILPSATETDALSTALLTVGSAGHEAIAALRPGMRTLILFETQGRLECQAHGSCQNQVFWPNSSYAGGGSKRFSPRGGLFGSGGLE